MAATVAEAHAYLVRKGHIDPIVALATYDGTQIVGEPHLPAEIGSLTKVFTGLLLAVMAERGDVRLDDRIPDLLPSGTELGPKLDEVSLEQLACHRSGLPRLPPGMVRRSFSRSFRNDPYAGLDGESLVASLGRTKVRGTPGDVGVRYSNYGMGLLGFLLGRASGMGYERTLTDLVLRPLGLSETTFGDTPLRQGHKRRRPVGPWHLAALAGAGALRSSADDLMSFLVSVRDGTGPLADAVAQTLVPRLDRGPVRPGLGWFLLGEGDLLMHDGGTLGARSEVRVERHSGRCVVILGDNAGGTAKAAAMLLDPMRRKPAR